jgi:hypothetical protein
LIFLKYVYFWHKWFAMRHALLGIYNFFIGSSFFTYADAVHMKGDHNENNIPAFSLVYRKYPCCHFKNYFRLKFKSYKISYIEESLVVYFYNKWVVRRHTLLDIFFLGFKFVTHIKHFRDHYVKLSLGKLGLLKLCWLIKGYINLYLMQFFYKTYQ